MGKTLKTTFVVGVIALAAVLPAAGAANAVDVTITAPTAQYSNGTMITITPTIECDTDYVIAFEAIQNQGRYVAVGISEVQCTATETLNSTIDIPAFDGMKFRKGPFTLLVKFFDASGIFVGGKGFQLRGK